MSILVAPVLKSKREDTRTRPRLGFLGLGWIGRNRMEAIAKSGAAEIVAMADVSTEMQDAAGQIAPEAEALANLDELLNKDLDGIVIATPSAQHAEQCLVALERGVAVFCQKPLSRSGKETRFVIERARKANRLLGVDLSYRHVNGVPALREIVQSGELGNIYAVDLVFHNAYGPNKAWFYDRKAAGGGCVIDLGIHLVDLAFWTLGSPRVDSVSSRLFSQGKPLNDTNTVEDYAIARLDLESGAAMQLACSWKLQAGCDAIIRASFYGTKGGIEFRNVHGSFYDFVVERFHGTGRETIAGPPDAWGARASIAWVKQLALSPYFDPEIEGLNHVAQALDRIYEPSL